MAEAEALYVRQLNLRERMSRSADEFVIWDVGLGAGGNVLTALHLTRDIVGRLRVLSFDRTLDALVFALQHADQLGFVSEHESVIRKAISEKQVSFQNGAQSVRWELVLGDFPSLLSRESRLPAPHAIFFDAFSPARNAEMWSLPLLKKLYSLLDPQRPCALATFSRSTIARTALLLAGFFVGRGEALAGKEETTIAANVRELVPSLLDHGWLARAKRSHSAEPLDGGKYVQRPLAPETWNALSGHAQFS